MAVELILVDLLEGHAPIGLLADFVLQLLQSCAVRTLFLSVRRSADLPVVRDAEKQPSALGAPQVRLVAQGGEVLAEVV